MFVTYSAVYIVNKRRSSLDPHNVNMLWEVADIELSTYIPMNCITWRNIWNLITFNVRIIHLSKLEMCFCN